MIALPVLLAVGILLCAAAVYGCRQAERAERAYPPAGKFVEVEGARLHYIRKGAGQPIVLLHGSDGFLEDYPRELMDKLALKYDVVAIDRPGHGYSDAPVGEAATPVVQVRLIIGVLHELQIEKALWVAHSWAALLAMIAAIEEPERVSGLVLLAPWIYPPTQMPPWSLWLLRIPVFGWLLAATLVPLIKRRLIRVTVRQAFLPDAPSAEFEERAASLWLRRPRQVLVFALEALRDRYALREFSARYTEIRVPVIAEVGDRDTIVPTAEHAERLKAALPAVELGIIPNTGHEIPHSRFEAVMQAVEKCSGRAVTAATSQEAASLSPAEHARQLVLRYGWNATAYQILNPRMELWFSADGAGVVGFVRRHGFRVVAGAPICAESMLDAAVTEFERSAARLGERVCYFAAAARLQSALVHQPGHGEIAIGAQPVWNPAGWGRILDQNSSLRAQLYRARNKAVEVKEWRHDYAERNDELKVCLAEWLSTRQMPPLQFLTAPVDLDDIRDRRVFVAEDPGGVVGYLVAAPVPDRNGWLIEQIVRANRAPNGVAELLVDAAMRAFGSARSTYVTLGLSPLSNRSEPAEALSKSRSLAPKLLLKWLRAHGRRFYNFDGLETFKAKFRPDAWEPITLISNEPRMSVRALYAVAAAFSGGPPIGAVVRASASAMKQEIVWLWNRRRTTREDK